MAVVERNAQRRDDSSAVVVPDRVLFQVSTLVDDEQSAVKQSLLDLETMSPADVRDPRLRRFLRDEPVYAFLAAPEVRLFLRLVPGKPIEVVDLIRTDTLWQTFHIADPFGEPR